jgi:cobalt-zinc-cadmium efflux system membrane fusion protein
MRIALSFFALLLIACQQGNHDHEANGGLTSERDNRPVISHTIWTDQTELFIEFAALTVGESSRFAAHFTRMEGHQALTEGKLSVILVKGEKEIRNTVEGPTNPGIFFPTLEPLEAGVYQLIFELTTPIYTDRIMIEDVRVFASIEEAQKALGEEEEVGGAISFLKEQSWKMEFQTGRAIEKEIYQTISTSGVWTVAPSDHRLMVATTSGLVDFKTGNLTEGSAVKKGQVIMSISSAGLTTGNLNTEIQKAKAALDQAESEYWRKKQLHESGIVPISEFEEVKQRFTVAKENYGSLSAGYLNGSKQIIVPFDGFVKSIKVENGGFVEQGNALFTISSHKNSLLEIQVSSAFSAQLDNIHDLFYKVGSSDWSSLNSTQGKVLSVSHAVAADVPMLTVHAQVNEVVEVIEGGFCEVELAVGIPSISIVIPTSALLEDYGVYSVIVQVTGESFERRNVTIGKRNGPEVEIVKGLDKGEVVVSKGAYQVKMASMSGQAPAHGHAH